MEKTCFPGCTSSRWLSQKRKGGSTFTGEAWTRKVELDTSSVICGWDSGLTLPETRRRQSGARSPGRPRVLQCALAHRQKWRRATLAGCHSAPHRACRPQPMRLANTSTSASRKRSGRTRRHLARNGHGCSYCEAGRRWRAAEQAAAAPMNLR